MQEKAEFSDRYKRLVDGNLAPEPEWADDMLKSILLRAFPRDPPESPGSPCPPGA